MAEQKQIVREWGLPYRTVLTRFCRPGREGVELRHEAYSDDKECWVQLFGVTVLERAEIEAAARLFAAADAEAQADKEA